MLLVEISHEKQASLASIDSGISGGNKSPEESVFVPRGAVHRIQNNFKSPVKIIEVQTGPILKESDIIRFEDVYGRIK